MSLPDRDVSDEIVEALAKRLFRAENPPHLLWDAALLERAGLPTEGYAFADDATRADCLDRARRTLAGEAQ